MKRIISIILSLTTLFSVNGVCFGAESAEPSALAAAKLSAVTAAAIDGADELLWPHVAEESDETEDAAAQESHRLAEEQAAQHAPSEAELYGEAESGAELFSAQNLTAQQLTKFNTVTAPTAGNGANEPKFSYNSFLEEDISDYSGELTLRFNDLTLEGRNGLDLRIGRTYQTVAANVGEKSVVILPNQNGYLRNYLVNRYSTYLQDRYDLGTGWGFGFPSVQIETEYEPVEVGDTYYYEEETEMYYHTGNGEVYPVRFTADSTDSNLKGYDKKDIHFNKNDTAYHNGQVQSYYSVTLADQTKQYFAEDGRLIGITDRFGNAIRFEHTMRTVANLVPDGNFRYDDDMWTVSQAADGTLDAYPVSDKGKDDSYSMYFRRNNTTATGSFILSQPIQVKPLTEYSFSMSVFHSTASAVDVEILGYDTAYGYRGSQKFTMSGYNKSEWSDFLKSFSTSSAVRYVRIKISPKTAKGMYIDAVSLSEPKPLLSKITDSIGRTVTFSYTGALTSADATGAVSLLVTAPDGSEKTLTYNKGVTEFATTYADHAEQRLFWYLTSSQTEGADGKAVGYEYNGGTTVNADGTRTYPKLYTDYTSKLHSDDDSWTHKPVLSIVQYKDRRKIYEYETVRKHLGDDGYYDTLRIRKRYDSYAYVPDGSNKIQFMGEIGAVTYGYSGQYNGGSFDNETGYPNNRFTDETNLGERWTVTKTGLTTDSITFTNCAVAENTTLTDGKTITHSYTNHPVFKTAPTAVHTTVSENGNSRESCTLYSYNDWGGVASATQPIDIDTASDAALLAKYTKTYQYDPTCHAVTQIRYYTDADAPAAEENYIYDSLGRLQKSRNAAGETVLYAYENADFPGLVTHTVQDDPMGFQHLLGGDKIVNYTYDSYGLYAVGVTQSYTGGTSQNAYLYDYITGKLLRHTAPDGGYTDYTYYTDGKLKSVVSPCTQYAGKLFFTYELHNYQHSGICEDYAAPRPVYGVETVQKFRVFTDAPDTLERYDGRHNFYDAVGNLHQTVRYDLSKTNADGSYVRIYNKQYYDNYDRLTKTVDDDGNTVQYAYDGLSRPLTVTDSENNQYTYNYDDVVGRVTLRLLGSSGTDTLLAQQTTDLRGNVTEQKVFPNGAGQDALREQFAYDIGGNVTRYTDPKGQETAYRYDSVGRLSGVTLPNGETAAADYSAFNTPSFEKLYNADGAETLSRASYVNEKGDLSMQFYSFGKRLSRADSFAFDAKGRMVSTETGGLPKAMAYDENDHLITETSGTSQILRRYDQNGEIIAASTDGSATEIRRAYSALGYPAQKRQGGTYNTYYTYSGTGRKTQQVTPSGRAEAYTYTPNGNLQSIATAGKMFSYAYYDNGLIQSVTYPNGLQTAYTYDAAGRVTAMETTGGGRTVNSLLYTYDANGNVLTETRNGAQTAYAYDSLDRLISVTYSDGSSVLYEYDALNNRTKETHSDGTVKEYAYNHAGQLSAVSVGGTVTDTYTYNAAGALSTHNGKTYTYDAWDRLSGYTDGTASYTYKYDTDGLRTQKNDTQYVVDIHNNVIAEANESGSVTAETIWGHRPLARKTGDAWYYYLYNAHGDVIGLTDESGTVVNSYAYSPWGEIRTQTESVTNPIKYAGEYYDDELDMLYLRARYYDPQIGRFISLDAERGSIQNPMDMNRYVYCRNNPIKYVDPTGEAFTSVKEYLAINNTYGIFTAEKVRKYADTSRSSGEFYAAVLGLNQTWDNEADALRHFEWNVLMTQNIGYGVARFCANLHEIYALQDLNWISGGNESTAIVKAKMNQATLMDLWNNQTGRNMAINSTLLNKSSRELFLYAKENGMLITDAAKVFEFLGVTEYVNSDWTINVEWDTLNSTIKVTKRGFSDLVLAIGY